MKPSVYSRPWLPGKSLHPRQTLAAAAALTIASIPLANAQLTPGEGGSIPNIPELVEPDDSITSLWVLQTDRERNTFNTGTEPILDLRFSSPASYGATGFDLQRSPDGVSGWETLYTTSGASQDNFSFSQDGVYYYRLLVTGGPRDGQLSNAVLGSISYFETQFSGWGGGSNWTPEGPTAPWLGHSVIAYFTVRDLSDSSTITGGVDFQWYRRNPQTGELTTIPGATSDTYTTTEDDLGGYELICRGTGDGESVGGYAQVKMDDSVVIFNLAEATGVSRSGFTLNLSKSVPSLTAEDLTLSYWDFDVGEMEIPITSVTAHEGNAVFDIVTDVPDNVEYAYLGNQSGVWRIGSRFGEGDWAHDMIDLEITFPDESEVTFAEWAVDSGLPEECRGPLDRNGPLKIQNLMAYAMGIDPLTMTGDDMPEITSQDPVAGTMNLTYRKAKYHTEATLTPWTSTDLVTWTAANVLTETVLEDGGDWEKRQATIELPPGTTAFLKFTAEQDTDPPLL